MFFSFFFLCLPLSAILFFRLNSYCKECSIHILYLSIIFCLFILIFKTLCSMCVFSMIIGVVFFKKISSLLKFIFDFSMNLFSFTSSLLILTHSLRQSVSQFLTQWESFAKNIATYNIHHIIIQNLSLCFLKNSFFEASLTL